MRRKRTYTRRRAALRWTCAALAALAALRMLAPYHLTPEAACRADARTELARPVRAVCRGEDAAGRLLVLSGNEEGMLLYWCQFQWQRGWQSFGLGAGERDRTAPFSAGRGFDESGVDEEVYDYIYIFGCVEDPAVAALTVAFHAGADGFDQTVRLTAEDWVEDGAGTRWFLCVLEPEREANPWSCDVTGYRADGTSVGTRRLMGYIARWEEAGG